MSGADEVDRAVSQLRDLAVAGSMPELGPVTGTSADQSAIVTVMNDGSVSVSLGQMSLETAQIVVAEAVADLLTRYERAELPGGVELPDFEGQLRDITTRMSDSMQLMRDRMDQMTDRARRF
ncbi:hypothetical protein [Tessaracoccus flavescens]|uniref:Uncharacterized protein n=1 Tax=Tessaracoccus flavescens TaxID=399497 RepID=A0A1Q2CVN1_9ACTN|nr:hypothetical protein [Tessaracoccus flavescens]AQP50182.1 hypothetical protein BW733_04360 [Tessaracoccus flavescens]